MRRKEKSRGGADKEGNHRRDLHVTDTFPGERVDFRNEVTGTYRLTGTPGNQFPVEVMEWNNGIIE
jgi:hypothetical protein